MKSRWEELSLLWFDAMKLKLKNEFSHHYIKKTDYKIICSNFVYWLERKLALFILCLDLQIIYLWTRLITNIFYEIIFFKDHLLKLEIWHLLCNCSYILIRWWMNLIITIIAVAHGRQRSQSIVPSEIHVSWIRNYAINI